MAERSLTVRIRIDDRTEQVEKSIIYDVKELLAKLDGEPRPTIEIAAASSESVAAPVVPAEE